MGDREWLGHRLMYVWFIGGHAPRRELDHVCNNTLCIRPNHLQPVTHRINAARRTRRARNPEAPFWTDDYLCVTSFSLLIWAGKYGLPAAPSHWDSPLRNKDQFAIGGPHT
ncbi:HNH endonuclease [Arthrobacter sp. ISL-85]|nr:HNH endonuclease [Arthrobacter sp. ISL-85]